MLRAALRIIVRLFFTVFTRLNIQGIQNIPSEGAVILASNHLGIVDAPLIFMLVDRKDATSLVADSYQEHVLIGWLVNVAGGIWINRNELDLRALRQALEYLRNGGLLGIAPEGTRSIDGALIQAKTGVAYLVDKAGCVPVVPVAIYGTEKLPSELVHLRRPEVCVRIGNAFKLPPINKRDRAASLSRNTDEIMCRIADMLPPEYRGFYSESYCLEKLGADTSLEVDIVGSP